MTEPMKFTLKHYRKAARIWLKPSEDISTDPARCVHFSVAWFQDPRSEEYTKEQQRECTAQLYEKLCTYLEKHENKLEFRAVVASKNCTYGHFDTEFEAIVTEARAACPFLSYEKNLPLEKHPQLPQDTPVIFHIAHSRSTSTAFNELMKSDTAVLQMVVETEEVNR